MYSLHPVKPLGGVSDAAALVTDDIALAQRLRELRNHGQDGAHRFLHHHVGYNARMDEISGGVLSHRLEDLDEAMLRRREIADRYSEGLRPLAPRLRCPIGGWELQRGWYAYVISTPERDALEAHLAGHGIETKIYYPYPLHLQPAFAFLDPDEGSFPEAEQASLTTLALPLYPELTDTEVDSTVERVVEFYDG